MGATSSQPTGTRSYVPFNVGDSALYASPHGFTIVGTVTSLSPNGRSAVLLDNTGQSRRVRVCDLTRLDPTQHTTVMRTTMPVVYASGNVVSYVPTTYTAGPHYHTGVMYPAYQTTQVVTQQVAPYYPPPAPHAAPYPPQQAAPVYHDPNTGYFAPPKYSDAVPPPY
eukprot:m.51431 g.51431  ORF g.51431 m.51431 type:complete len:167 (-) comp6611_c0_seq1:93-593(-)